MKMKKEKPLPLSAAIGLLIIGVLLGSIFTFGMQYWNTKVERNDCTVIETELLSYKEIKRLKHIKEIIVDCTNGKRYSIDGKCVNIDVRSALSKLSEKEDITLLIHPNSNTIVEFSTDEGYILEFEDSIAKLDRESNDFLFLGIFLYFCAIVGLIGIISHGIQKRKASR